MFNIAKEGLRLGFIFFLIFFIMLPHLQPQGHVVHQSPTGGTMRKPSLDMVRAPAPERSQFQQQTIEPCAHSAFTATGKSLFHYIAPIIALP